jgi:membrane protein DedA with SNARE-associated domain
LGIGYFAAGLIAAIIGAAVGGGISFLIGHNLDRMANRK